MRSLLIVPFLLLAGSAHAGEGQELLDKSTGVGVTLPEDWSFAVDEVALTAVSPDKMGMVFLMATEQGFEQELLRIEHAFAGEIFESVRVQNAAILVGEDRGALEGAVALNGTAIHRADGSPVEFAAMLVKSGDKGEMVLGAWKDAAHAELIRGIIGGLHVREPLGSGLKLTDKRTGATITVPDKWSVLRKTHGLLAVSPTYGGMALIVRSEDDFEKTVERTRAMLRERVFENVEIEEAMAIEASAERHGFLDMVAAKGTAIDRADKKKCRFKALTGKVPGEDNGVLIVGVWKDEDHRALVESMLDSLVLAPIQK